MDASYVDAWIYKSAMILLVAGALNWLAVGVAGVNIVDTLFGGRGVLGRIVYVLVGLAALYVMFRRDFYLPFLGKSVVPCGGLKNHMPPGATEEVTVKVTPGAKVLYWGAEAATKKLEELNDWRGAYLGFENAGVATADSTGTVVLRLRAPQPYTVPLKGRLESHVHYRVCGGDGMMSPVQTVFMEKKAVEGFTCGVPMAGLAPVYH